MARLERFQHLDYVFHLPKPIGHAGSHRRRHFERLMDADEVVIQKMQRHRVRVIGDFFLLNAFVSLVARLVGFDAYPIVADRGRNRCPAY